MNNKVTIGGFVGLGFVAVVSLVHDIYQTVKMNTVCKNLGTTLDKVRSGMNIEVEEDIIRDAVEKAAKAEAERIINEAKGKASAIDWYLNEREESLNERINYLYNYYNIF